MLLFAATITTLAIAGNTNNENVAKPVLSAFSKEFQNVSDVSWEKVNDEYLVYFTKDNTRFTAYYNSEGNRYGAGRFVNADYLPLTVMNKIDEKYEPSQIKNVLEFSSDTEGLYYFVQLKNSKADYVLKISGNGTIDVVKKIKADQ